jgi:hypothetical protein
MTSSGAGRIDAYHYEQNARELTLGGEGIEFMDMIIPAYLAWDDTLSTPIEDSLAKRILCNITAPIQRCRFSVSFSNLEDDEGTRE